MVSKKNILVGKNKLSLLFFSFLTFFFIAQVSIAKDLLDGNFTDLKILDKISSKNTLIKLKIGELTT